MKIDKKEIEHISTLARLELTDKEEELFASQISSILDYMKILDEVDVKDVSGTAFIGDLKNVWRKDVVEEWSEDEKKLSLDQSEKEDDLVKVKRVLA